MTETATDASFRRPYRVAVYPPGVNRWANPYFRLFHAALAKRGIVVTDDLDLAPTWLKSHAGKIDAVHLHWPERIWNRNGFGRLDRFTRTVVACSRLAELRRSLRLAQRLGMRRIWTVHNIEPHEGAFRWDRLGYRLVAGETDLVICHSQDALHRVHRLYPPRKASVVMPIGDHAGDYPAPRPRTDVLRELGLNPEIPLVCCLGRLRHYKGLDLACEITARLQGRVQLVIGGVRHAGFDVSPVRAMVEKTPGAVLIDRTLSTQEYADLIGASEAMLLPYLQITGSAALLSALGCGRGVITSDLPFFREVLWNEPDAGVLVAGRDPAAWSSSVLAYLARPAGVRGAAALRLAGRYGWDRCVEPLVAALGALGVLDARTPGFDVDPVHA